MDPDELTRQFIKGIRQAEAVSKLPYKTSCAGFPPCTISHPEWLDDIKKYETKLDIDKLNSLLTDCGDASDADLRGFILPDGSMYYIWRGSLHYETLRHIPGVPEYYHEHLEEQEYKPGLRNKSYGMVQGFLMATGAMRFSTNHSDCMVRGMFDFQKREWEKRKDGPANVMLNVETNCCPTKAQLKSLSQMVQELTKKSQVRFYMDIGRGQAEGGVMEFDPISIENTDLTNIRQVRPLARLM
tara:strand:+ start:1047 stop:1772 length:726 start_codon:yes stop_codon:yes gene_type:complete